MDHFIPNETFEALQYICYGFAAVFFEFAIKEGQNGLAIVLTKTSMNTILETPVHPLEVMTI
jgi:hypothetical protein